MNYPTTRIVFDRKKTATETKPALIQIEVLYGRKKKYISTGVRVCKNQYSMTHLVINRFDMDELNKRIKVAKANIDTYITELMINNAPFSFEQLQHFIDMEGNEEKRFIDYVAERIEERKDIRESTRKMQRKLFYSLEQFGKIIYFADLTKRNIMAYDDFLHNKGIKQTTIYSYHKLLKTYIHDAIRREMITADPYIALQFKRGESESGRFLTEEEFRKIRDVELPGSSLQKVRDLFVVQCLTGLSYSDLMAFDFSNIKEINGQYTISERRVKTGVEYCTVLLPDVMKIVKRYDFKMPVISNQQYNLRLKIVAERAGVYKDVASHWGRRTCGMLLLNKGVSMEVVSRVLGHSSIKTTEAVYAKILNATVVREISDKLL